MSDYSRSNPGWLLSRAKQDGDLNALLDIYRSYVKLLARVQIGSHLAGKFDASDVVQEVYLRATRAFTQFRGTTEKEFLGWLRQILASVLATLVRRFHEAPRDVRLERDLNQQLEDASSAMQMVLAAPNSSPSEKLLHKERAVVLAEALEQLPDDYREVVVLRHIEQLPFQEIAERMGRSLHSVRNIWPRALARLKRSLGTQL